MRRALPEDAEEISELEIELFPENCFNAHTIKREVKHSPCWVVDGWHRKLKGYLITRLDTDLVDILRVGVRQEHWGQGLGYRFMMQALRLAPRATLLVRKDNERALKLYFSLGFQIAGEFEQSWMMLTS